MIRLETFTNKNERLLEFKDSVDYANNYQVYFLLENKKAKFYYDYADGYDYYDTPEKGKTKTLTGKPIPAHGTVTYTWNGHGYTFCELESYDDFKLKASVSLLSKGENSAKSQIHFTGKEYEEYLAEKNKQN